MPFFEHVPLAPPDPILGLTAAFFADQREKKVNLGVGYYRDEMLRTPILKCVKQAEKILLESESNKEYLSIDGHGALIDKVGELVFGEIFWKKERSRVAGFQTVGGTGALKVAGIFCAEELKCSMSLPSLSWPNHRGVFSGCHMPIDYYPYYNLTSHELEIEKLHAFLQKQMPGSIILLHASCHNPTGRDPSLEEWKTLAALMAKKKLIAFFDFAYQGFGEGLSEDAKAVRLFAENCKEMCVAFSAAKNFSAYGERVGALFIVGENAKTAEHITSRIKQIIRTNYSNPPKHGAVVVAHILCDPQLKALWIEELNSMRSRIQHLRMQLADRLIAKSKMCNFEHLRKGLGMFCFTGLQERQVDRLILEYGIYMPRDGRINLCGLSHNNIDYVVDAIICCERDF